MASYGPVGSKRRRIDQEPSVRMPSGSRSRPHAAVQHVADQVHDPKLDFAALPASSVHKYLLHSGLLPADALDFRHAMHPPLATGLRPSALGPAAAHTMRSEKGGRFKSARLSNHDYTSYTPQAYRQIVDAPTVAELAGPPAVEQDPEAADMRLVMLAQSHWERTPSVKEGETVSAFMFALRKRGRLHN